MSEQFFSSVFTQNKSMSRDMYTNICSSIIHYNLKLEATQLLKQYNIFFKNGIIK